MPQVRDESLARLSSGSKVSSTSDSAASSSSQRHVTTIWCSTRIQAAIDNVGNAGDSRSNSGWFFFRKLVVHWTKFSELSMLAQDETKTDADRALYDKEFQKLDDFIVSLGNKDFNGVSLFHNGSSLTVVCGTRWNKYDSGLRKCGGIGRFHSVSCSSDSVLSDRIHRRCFEHGKNSHH